MFQLDKAAPDYQLSDLHCCREHRIYEYEDRLRRFSPPEKVCISHPMQASNCRSKSITPSGVSGKTRPHCLHGRLAYNRGGHSYWRSCSCRQSRPRLLQLFRYFATMICEGEVYMTVDDFMRSLVRGEIQPSGMSAWAVHFKCSRGNAHAVFERSQ
jgi:hypothetical protein